MVELHNTLSKFMVDRMKWLESTNVESCNGLAIKIIKRKESENGL